MFCTKMSMFKPIFHCDAKPFALGTGVGLDPQLHTFASPNACWYILALPNAKICVTPTPNLKFALPPTPTPDASQWNIVGVGSSGVGHVHFMYISCCLCIIFSIGHARISQCKPSFQWNMGSTVFTYLLCG